jgi:hypothetical protein
MGLIEVAGEKDRFLGALCYRICYPFQTFLEFRAIRSINVHPGIRGLKINPCVPATCGNEPTCAYESQAVGYVEWNPTLSSSSLSSFQSNSRLLKDSKGH